MSFLLPDPAEINAIADRIGTHASLARARAGALGLAVAETGWRGLAADTFEAMAHHVLAGLRHSADRLDDAADALRRHARRVQDVLDQLRRLEHDLLGLGGDLGHLLHDGLLSPADLLGDGAGVLTDGAGVLRDVGGLVGGAGHLLGIG